jgi:hypothetical protein
MRYARLSIIKSNDIVMRTHLTTILTGLGATLLTPLFALAQGSKGFDPTGGAFGASLQNIIYFINYYVIPFVLGVAFLFFVIGMFWYFIKGGSDEEAQGKGKQLIIYALAGFVLIFIFWGLVQIIATGTGLDQSKLDGTLIPIAPGGR